MSEYTTQEITRGKAEEILRRIKARELNFRIYSDKEIQDELDNYTYNRENFGIIESCTNFLII